MPDAVEPGAVEPGVTAPVTQGRLVGGATRLAASPSVAVPVAFALGASVSVQTGVVFAKQLFPVVGTFGALLLRAGVSAVVTLALTRPSLRSIPRRTLGVALLFGVVMLLLNLSFYSSITRIPLGVCVTLEYAGPLALAVAGSRRARDLMWAALAAGGVALLTGGGEAFVTGRLDPLGVVLALVAGGWWAAYIVLSKRVGALLPRGQGLGIAYTVVALGIAPFGVATAGARLLSWHVLLLGLALGLLSSAIPASLEMAALRRMPIGAFGVLMSQGPAVAATVGFLLLGERLSHLDVLAIALVGIASAGASLGSRPPGSRSRGSDDPRVPRPAESAE